jgi:hypothetical protein
LNLKDNFIEKRSQNISQIHRVPTNLNASPRFDQGILKGQEKLSQSSITLEKIPGRRVILWNAWRINNAKAIDLLSLLNSRFRNRRSNSIDPELVSGQGSGPGSE